MCVWYQRDPILSWPNCRTVAHFWTKPVLLDKSGICKRYQVQCQKKTRNSSLTLHFARSLFLQLYTDVFLSPFLYFFPGSFNMEKWHNDTMMLGTYIFAPASDRYWPLTAQSVFTWLVVLHLDQSKQNNVWKQSKLAEKRHCIIFASGPQGMHLI